MKKLPIGIQNIQEIITDGYIYVDKTRFALELINNGKHYLLSRPRRQASKGRSSTDLVESMACHILRVARMSE